MQAGRQRLTGAYCAAVMKPAALLLDEPTASLDQDAVAAVEALLTSEQARGLMLVLVTHDAAQAARMGHQTLHIAAGKAVPA